MKINDHTDDFDRWLALPGVQRRTSIVEASVDARDTLKGCWHAVRSVFGTDARPEHALTLLPLVLARADAARRRSPGADASQS